MKKLTSAGMKLLEEVLVISLQFGYQPVFGLEQFRQEPDQRAGASKQAEMPSQKPILDAPVPGTTMSFLLKTLQRAVSRWTVNS